MININSIDSSIKNLNTLLDKNYVNSTELNISDYLNENYFIHLGYYNEKELFEELIHKHYDENEDIFSYNNVDKYVINNTISYYNKYYIDNPHNDYYLKYTKIVDAVDLTKNNVCDMNISKILNKKFNNFLLKLEFLRNLYYYISTKQYVDKYEYDNNLYHFEIPTKYFISDRKNIIKNNYNSLIKFKVKVYNKKINIIFEQNANITDNLLESIKPMLHYHMNLITNDSTLKLSNVNKYDSIKSYAEEISNKYDNIRFASNLKILKYLQYKNYNEYTEYFINNYLNIIESNYKSFDKIKKENTDIYDTNDNSNNNTLDDFIVNDPNENFDDNPEKYEKETTDNIDKNIIKDTEDNDILFDDINEKNEIFDTEKKLNSYKNIIFSLIVFLSVLSLFIITYLIIKIVANDFNVIDIILSFVIIIKIITILILIFLYSSDDYLKKLFFLNKEHFTTDYPTFSKSQLHEVFNLFDDLNNSIKPVEELEPRDTSDETSTTQTPDTEDNLETIVNKELQENEENIKRTELDITDTKEKLMDLKIDSEDFTNKIEYDKMKLENFEKNSIYNKNDLENRELFSIDKENYIIEQKAHIKNLTEQQKKTQENFTDYIRNVNILEEQYIRTVTDIEDKLKKMDTFNKYEYLEDIDIVDTSNYQFGTAIEEDSTQAPSDDNYTSYDEEEINKYNYIDSIEDLNQVIKGYKLEQYIQIKDNLLDVSTDLVKLNEQTLQEVRNAALTNQMEIVMNKLDTTKKLIELSKMIAAINLNKKINMQVEIETQENKLSNAVDEYRSNYEEILALKNNINSENELRNKIISDIDLYEKSIEKIGEDVLKLSKKLEEDEKKKNDYITYYDYTYDKLKQLNMDKIEKDLLKQEKIKNVELYEISNLEIIDSKIGMELVNNKYKIEEDNKELYKVKEYELDISNKYKNIDVNYKKQIEYFTRLQQENVKDELFRMKIETKKTTLDSSNRINNEHNIRYTSEINNLKEILEKDTKTLTKVSKIVITLNNTIDDKNQRKQMKIIKLDELKSNGMDENNDVYKKHLFELEKLNLEIHSYTKEYNRLNSKKQEYAEKIKNSKTEIQKIENRSNKSNKMYQIMINNNKNEYELLLIQENFILRKRNLLLIEVSKIIKEINDDKENVITIINKKTELIRKNNSIFQNSYNILINDKKILEKEKRNTTQNLQTILQTSCLLFNKIDNKINIECSRDNIEEINLKINELLKSDLIADKVLISKLINIKASNTLLNKKEIYLSLLIFKYELDIITNMIKHLVKEIQITDSEINLNNLKIDKLEFHILYKTVVKNTLENEKKRIGKVIKNLLDKNLEYKKEYQNIEHIIDNYFEKKKIQDEITEINKNIDYNRKKEENFSKHISNETNIINKLNKDFLKIKDELSYDTKKKVESKLQKIELLTSKFSEYYTLIAKYVELKNKYENIDLAKYIFIPIILSDDNKKHIFEIFNDNEKEFKEYISNDSRYENLKNMIDNITNIIVIDKDKNIKYAKIVIKFDINYDMFNDKQSNIEQFKIDIINTLSSTLTIDKRYINIVSITNNQNILLNVNIETNEKYKTQQEIVDYLKRQVLNKDSELKKNSYGENITEIISNIKEIENSILTKMNDCDGAITMPNYLSDTRFEGDYFDDIFKYCNVELHKNVLLLYLPLITKEEALDNTLTDYSIHGRTVYEALCKDASIRKIYKNYIELDNTLLKVDNINLIDRQEYSISFIAKLNETNDNKQHILISNGQIYQTFNLTLNSDNPNKIIWESYFSNEKQTFYNNNILTIGFMNKHLYINLPCLNNKEFNRIIDDSDKLYVNENEWYHWIITRKNNKIIIYKNLTKIFETNITENSISESICNTNSSNYDKKTLYIGGIKTDLDSNTRILNDLVCFKGGLKDFRIYDVELKESDISSIFINNCETNEENRTVIDRTFTESPKLSDDSYIQNSEKEEYTGELTTDTDNKIVQNKSSSESDYKIIHQYDTKSFGECNNFIEDHEESEEENLSQNRNRAKFTYITSHNNFHCIKDNKPCFDMDDISYYDDYDNEKYCINNKDTTYSKFNYRNTKDNELFKTMNEVLLKNNKYGNISDNYGCKKSSEKRIYDMTTKAWECIENSNNFENNFECHDKYYNYQLPIKKQNGEFDCISEMSTGNYYENENMYKYLKGLLNDSVAD